MLTGTGIIKLKNINVKTGKATIWASIVTFLLGAFLLIFDTQGTKSLTSAVGNQPTSDEENQAVLLLSKAQNWDLVLLDDFDQNKANWHTGKDNSTYNNSDIQIVSSKYNWKIFATTEKSTSPIAVAKLEPHESFYLAVDGNVLNGTGTYFYGLDFRSQGTDKYYQIKIYPQSKWFTVRYRDGSIKDWNTLLLLPNSNIEKSSSNHISVIATGSEYWFFVNDSFLGHILDARLTGGLVGLSVGLDDGGGEVEVEFDNFEYRSAP